MNKMPLLNTSLYVTLWVYTYNGKMFVAEAIRCPKLIADNLGLKDVDTINSNQVLEISKKIYEWALSLAQQSEQ